MSMTTEIGDGRAAFTGTPGLRACNPMGVVHGSYIATLLVMDR
jgi:acyl-coenzyme A thioesterase PaaI-like protein